MAFLFNMNELELILKQQTELDKVFQIVDTIIKIIVDDDIKPKLRILKAEYGSNEYLKHAKDIIANALELINKSLSKNTIKQFNLYYTKDGQERYIAYVINKLLSDTINE